MIDLRWIAAGSLVFLMVRAFVRFLRPEYLSMTRFVGVVASVALTLWLLADPRQQLFVGRLMGVVMRSMLRGIF